MKKKLTLFLMLFTMSCCLAIRSFGQNQLVKFSNLLEDFEEVDPETIFPCSQDAFLSGEVDLEKGWFGTQCSDQGRPDLASKFFQSFENCFYPISKVRVFGIFRTFDEQEGWISCDDRSELDENLMMKNPIELEVSFYKIGKDGLPDECVYTEDIKVAGRFTQFEPYQGKVMEFFIPLNEEVKLESGFISISAKDLNNSPKCWFNVVVSTGIPGYALTFVENQYLHAPANMSYCFFGNDELAAKKAIKINAITNISDYSNSSNQKVNVEIRNIGSDTYTNPTLELKVDNKVVSTETIDISLQTFETYHYTFNKRIDLSNPGKHIIEIKNVTKDDEHFATPSIMKETITLGSDEYCESKSQKQMGYISSVIIGNIHNSSKESDYSDFTDLETSIHPNEELSLNVTFEGSAKYLKVWVDWNEDGIFDNESEFIGYITENEISISIPKNTTIGKKRLRIICSEEDTPACGVYYSGETEDYTLNVVSDNDSPQIKVSKDILHISNKEVKSSQIEISNIGAKELDGSIEIMYDLPNSPRRSKVFSAEKQCNQHIIESAIQDVKANNSGDKGSYCIAYDNGVKNSISPADGNKSEFAHLYPYQMLSDLKEMKISSVDVFINEAPAKGEIIIYTSKKQSEPENEVQRIPFVPKAKQWNTIKLNKQIEISGDDNIWVSVSLEEFNGKHFCIGVDYGPAIVGFGDKTKFSSTNWLNISEHGLNANYCIRTNLSGEKTSTINWLQCEEKEFNLEPKGRKTIEFSIDADKLEKDVYEARIVIHSNSAVASEIVIPVYYINNTMTDLSSATIEDVQFSYQKDSRTMQIKSDSEISSIELYSLSGFLKELVSINSHEVALNIGESEQPIIVVLNFSNGKKKVYKFIL